MLNKYNDFKLKFVLKDSERSKRKKHNIVWTNRNSYIDQLTKESPINAFNGLDSLKWIRFDELKNIDNLTEHKFCSAKWMIGDQTQHKRGIKVVLINLDYSHENIKKIYLECHDQLSIHDILGITQDPQDGHYLLIIKMTSKLLMETLRNFLNKEKLTCKKCKTLNNTDYWCKKCNAHRFEKKFIEWTSGNKAIDEFIRNSQLNASNDYNVLEWIPYEKFKKIKYLDKGGFGSVYKATWTDGRILEWNDQIQQWKRKGKMKVALKILHNSYAKFDEFLQEIKFHLNIAYESCTIWCYGITKHPITNNFIMVLEYASHGNLRNYLNHNLGKLSMFCKIDILLSITMGLKAIHSAGLVHGDLHSGNVLCDKFNGTNITDLGLCFPVDKINELNDKKRGIYGVLPYIAPEVLRGHKYTKASDVYSFGIIMNELLSERLPFYKTSYDGLIFSILSNRRPKIKPEVPDLFKQLIIRCWDSLPANRPNADELFTTIYNLWKQKDNQDSELYKQIQKSKDFPKRNPRVFSSHRITSRIYSTAYYTNRPLNISTFPKHLSSDFNIRSISIPNQNLLESRNSYFIIINPNNSANPNNPDIVISKESECYTNTAKINLCDTSHPIRSGVT